MKIKRPYFKKGVTLVELLMSILLLSMIFLAVSSLHIASQRMFFSGNDKVIISYELQHAIQHIHKNVMRGIGDQISLVIRGGEIDNRVVPSFSPLQVLNQGNTLNIRINNNEVLTRDNYDDVVIYQYSKVDDELIFSVAGEQEESLASRIGITDVDFSLDENLLTVSLTGTYKDQTLSFHTACYPRLASYQ